MERFNHHIKKMLADSLVTRYPHLENQPKIKDLGLCKFEPLCAKHFIALGNGGEHVSEQIKKTLDSFSFITRTNLVKNPKASEIGEHDLVHLLLDESDWVENKKAKRKISRQLELGLTKGALFVVECLDFNNWSTTAQQAIQDELFKHKNPRVITIVHHSGKSVEIKKEDRWTFLEVEVG